MKKNVGVIIGTQKRINIFKDMTQVNMYVCDDCGFTDPQDDPNMEIEIKQCVICSKDICESCAELHAKDETGLVWVSGK